jgi:hypothetical protein
MSDSVQLQVTGPLAGSTRAQALDLAAGLGPCLAAEPDGEGGWFHCGARASAVYVYACVHEHVTRRATCAEHEPVPGEIGCRQCFDLGHDCPVDFWPASLWTRYLERVLLPLCGASATANMQVRRVLALR